MFGRVVVANASSSGKFHKQETILSEIHITLSFETVSELFLNRR